MMLASRIRDNLEKDPSVVYFLDRRLRITHCNPAWDRFAAENGGEHLTRQAMIGTSVLEVIPAPLKPFYGDGYDHVFSSLVPWEHTYECSSPTIYRSFRMGVYLDPEEEGLVVVNSLTVEHPHGNDREPHPSSPAYASANEGIVTMCSHCRRTQRIDSKEVWDWVPAYVENRPQHTSHGLCPICTFMYYPELFRQ
jgi:hypothetical protein